jgi:hypothetical protein
MAEISEKARYIAHEYKGDLCGLADCINAFVESLTDMEGQS